MEFLLLFLQLREQSSILEAITVSREIFILSRYELLSYTEISERLNISVNTVKTQISRALDSLRISLKKYL